MLPVDAKLHPSAAGRWRVCPGSAYLESLVPNVATDASREGDAIHAVGAAALYRKSPVDAWAGREVHGTVVTGDMLDVAREYVEALQAANVPLFIESPVGCPSIHPNCKGTPDAFYYHIDSRTVFVWDLKTGWRIVEAEGNNQCAVYLSGIVDWIERERLPRPNRFVATIVQPRPWHPDGTVRQWIGSIEEIQGVWRELAEAAALAFSSEPPLHTGTHCRDCDAIATCPAARAHVGATQDMNGRAIPDQMDPATLAHEILRHRAAMDVLKPRLEALEAQGYSLLKHGGQLPGFVLKPGRGSRSWTVSNQALETLGKLSGVELFVRKPLSPAQAEKAGVPKETVKELCKTQTGAPVLALGDAAEAARKVFCNG